MIFNLLCKISDQYSQALIYPLTVVLRSNDITRKRS